ncbi:MAG TPA: sulfotransferase family 2 domain-containing protein [Jatrophihabitantaceae bacterium]|jgi:hypothetical protein
MTASPTADTAATGRDPLAALGNTRRAYVVEPYKVLYISTAKNACTSIKWLIAELAGDTDNLENAPMGLFPAVSREQIVHKRGLYQHTPTLGRLSKKVRSSIHPDNGWFVFSVVRDPRSRVFSAWQNKFLTHSPSPFYQRWNKEPWYPSLPASNDDIIGAFAQFVDLIDKNPDHEVTHDAHFRTQEFILARDSVPYSNIYEISQMNTMLSELTAHVRANGWTGPDLALRSVNDTPLKPYAAVFDGPVRAAVERFYGPDFETFGHLWDFAKIERAPEWDAKQLAAIRQNTMVNDRFAELLGAVDRATTRAQRAEAASRPGPAIARAATLADRIKGRLKREIAARRRPR